jgi:GntR family transcriptional regulator/MocR family aminotransferase
MGAALAEHLPECRVRPSIGGTAYWIEGPNELDANELARRASEAGILIEPGDVHFMSTKAPTNFFRLGFSSIPVDKIEPGIKLLGEILRK